MKEFFTEGSTVLFYGDSITDAGRDKENGQDLGKGYAAKIAALYSVLFPNQHIRFFNRGVSGNVSADLLKRYEKDLLALKPQYVFILIGINDTWHGWAEGNPIPAEVTRSHVRELIQRIRNDLEGTRVMVLQPWLLDSDPAMRILIGKGSFLQTWGRSMRIFGSIFRPRFKRTWNGEMLCRRRFVQMACILQTTVMD